MNQNIETIRNSIQTLADKLETITASAAKANRALTDSEQIAAESIQAAIESQQAIVRESKAIDIVRAQEAQEARVQGRPSVKAIAKTSSYSSFKNPQDAYDTGRWFQAAFCGDEDAIRYCKSRGIQAALSTGDNTKGGFLVNESLSNSITELRETYGVFRRESQVLTMGGGSLTIPQLATEVTAYYVGEGVSITPSDVALGSIKLDPKKLATLTVFSSEVDEDAAMSIAEMLARSVAQSFAIAEDQAGFLGDGTSTYGGITGLITALNAGSCYTATSRQTFGALTMADFESIIGQAKEWAGYSPKWYISKAGWASSMQRLANAVGGNDNMSIANGTPASFLGYPVVWSQVLESRLTGTTGGTFCFFGDLRQGTYLGSRRDVRLALDSSRYFEQDSIALRATQRYDIRVHDVGTSTASGGIVRGIFG
jgi:HK97 family phage major capsid protein